MEKWIMHAKTKEMSTNIIQLFPIIESIHSYFSNDIICIDMERVKLLFNNGDLDKNLIDSTNPFWTKTNPFPINSIASDKEILSIWDRIPQGTQKLIFTQNKKDIESLIDLKNKNPLNTILVLCTYFREKKDEKDKDENEKKYTEICTCYMIRLIIDKDKNVQFLLTIEPTVIIK